MTIPAIKRFMYIAVFVFLFAMGGATRAYAQSVSIDSLYPTGGISPGQQVSFYAHATGFYIPSYAVSDSLGGTAGTINSQGYFTWTPVVTDAGIHTITVTVTDTVGNQATASITIPVVSNAVLIGGFSPGTLVAVNKAVTFTASAPGFINPIFSASDSYIGTSISNTNLNPTSGSFSWTPGPNQQGLHVLTVSASDLYGHSGTVTQSFTVGGLSFNLTPIHPAASVVAGTKITFNAVASAAAPVTYSVNDIFNGSTTLSASNLSPSGAFSWTPTAGDIGVHDVVVTATDSLSNAASTTAFVTVTAPPLFPTAPTLTPTITTPPVITGSTNQQSGTTQKGDGYLFSTFLTTGSTGTAVTELQKRLTAAGVYSGPVTGYYGVLTTAAVKNFQTAHSIASVGYVGPMTRAALNSI